MENYQDLYEEAQLELQTIALYAKANGYVVIETETGEKLRLNLVEEKDEYYLDDINNAADEIAQTGAYLHGLFSVLDYIQEKEDCNFDFDIYEAIDHIVFLHNLVCGTQRGVDKLLNSQTEAFDEAFSDGYPKVVHVDKYDRSNIRELGKPDA